jgi:hypothetical protein
MPATVGAPSIRGNRSVAVPRTLDWARSVKNQLERGFTTDIAPITLLDSAIEHYPEDPFIQRLNHAPLRLLGPLMACNASEGIRTTPFARLVEGAERIAAQGEAASASKLAVGYGMREDESFGIEIRLQNPTVSALLRARNLVAHHGLDGASIGIVRQLTTHADGPHPASVQNDPLTLGSSVGVADGYAGTLGGFARNAGGQVGILSCSHILARSGAGRRGDAVYHPSPVDDALESKRIGSLNLFEDMRKSGERPWDAAFALVEGEGPKCGHNVVPRGQRFPRQGSVLGREVRTPLPPFPNVAKIGRASGWTKGQVVAENFGPLEIWFPALNRNVTVSNLIEIAWGERDDPIGKGDPFSKEGDSGSLIYLEKTLEPLGLLVGGGIVTKSDTRYGRSYACPLAPILDKWRLELL